MNALAGLLNPLQVGQMVQSGFQQGREMRAGMETENALSKIAMNPEDQEARQSLARFNPQMAMHMQERDQQRQQAQMAERQQQMGTVRQLLAKAGSSPEGWAQAMGAAQQMGIDTSTLPQQYDPQWAQQQMFIMDALERDQDKLPGLAQELQAAGYEPGTPEFTAAMRQVINSKYASDYVDQSGNTRRRSVLDLGGQGGPQPGAVEDGYRFKGGNPSDPNSWEPVEPTIQNTPAPQVGANGMPQVLSRQQYQATVASMGKAATDAWMQRNNIRMGN
jgi:hypothetical protein